MSVALTKGIQSLPGFLFHSAFQEDKAQYYGHDLDELYKDGFLQLPVNCKQGILRWKGIKDAQGPMAYRSSELSKTRL